MAGKTGRAMLSRMQVFNLMKVIDAEYAQSGLTDAEFARSVSERLQIPQLNRDHVCYSRQQMGIESNKERKEREQANPEGRLATIEQSMKELFSQIDDLSQRLGDLEVGLRLLKAAASNWPADSVGARAHLK